LGERIIMTQSMPWDDFATSRSEPVKEDEGNPWEEFAAQAKNDRPRSKLNSALQGAAQGATFGFSDEGLAGLKAAYDKFKEGGDWQDLYHKRVNAERRAISQAKEDNPLTYTGGLVGGSALTNLIPGVGIAKGAALGSTLGKATLQGALTGAGESTGKTQGDILVDTLKGGALGGVAQGVFSGLGGLAEKLTPTALKRFAEERAVKAALGPTEASIKKGLGLPKDGAPVEYVQSQIAKHGRNLLDEGVISPFNKTEDIGPRLTSAMRKYGSQIGEIGATVDDKLPGSFDPSKISQEILDYAATLPVAGKGGGLQDSLLKEAE
jgi:hypothetical protein